MRKFLILAVLMALSCAAIAADFGAVTLKNVTILDNSLYVISKDYLQAVVEGDISGHYVVRKTGYNGDVDDSQEDLWTVGGTYVFPLAGQKMNVVSSVASDNSAGTGVRTVELSYLDNAWVERQEIITLNGTTPVLTVADNIYRIQQFHAVTAGSSNTSAGSIDIRNNDNTTIYGRIPAGYNSSQQAIWTVPEGRTFYVTGWSASAGSKTANNYVEIRLRATCGDAGTLTPNIFRQFATTVLVMGAADYHLTIPKKIPARADVKISAIGSAGTANYIVSGHFVGWYEE